MSAAAITVHTLPPSHPCAAVVTALRLKGLVFEEAELPMDGSHVATLAAIYGEEHTRVPQALFDGEQVHGSSAILERIEQAAAGAEPRLFPPDKADAVREAAAWGDETFQPLGRSLPWGALAFAPTALSLIGGGSEPLDPPSTDFAMKMTHALWKRHEITCARLGEELRALPGHLDRIDAWIADGTLGGESPNAADLQIGATIAVLLMIADLRPLIEGRPCAALARHLPARPGEIPAGALPAHWLPG